MARDLKLQVVLDAVNRATRPLKKITEGSEGTARALRESREQLKTLERAQKDMRGFRDLKQQSDKTSLALGEQQQEIRDLTRQMNNAEGATGDLARKRAAAIRQAKKLKDRYRDEQRQLHELRGSMTRIEGVTGSYSDQQRQLAERVRKANQQIQEQKQRLSEAARQQRRAADAANRYHRNIGRAGRMAGTGAAGMATGGAALYGGARMLTPGVDWGSQMSAVQAVGRFEDDDPRLKALKQQSRDLGGSTAFSANEVGAGQEFLLRAGMSAKAIQSSMRDVLDLAIANNTELGRTADIASNIAGTFKIDLEQEGAMTRVADVLSATASRANVDLEKLGETVKYLGGAEDLNLTLEQASTMAGLLGNVGIQGSQAGTTLRAMMNRLTEPTAEAAGVIDSLGIKVADAQGNMRAMPEILRDINDATKEMGNVERKAALQKIFGAEAGSGLAELVSQMSTGELDALLTEIQNATGENARMARTMEDNLGGDLKSLNSAWQEVGITLTDTNEGPLRDLIQNVTAITRAVGDWMKQNPELTAQLATVAAFTAGLVAVGGSFLLVAGSLLGPIAMIRYGMELFGLKTEGAGKKARKASKGGIKVLGGALKWLGRLIAWVGRAFLLNPIGLVVTAIAGAAYLIYKNWEPISQFFKDRWADIKAAFSDGVGAVFRLLISWNPIGLIYRGITAGLEALGIDVPENFKTLGGAIVDGLIGGITRGLSSLGESIMGMGHSIMTWFKDVLGINSPSRVFAEFGGNLIEGLINGLDEKWQLLKDKISNVADGVVGWFSNKLGIRSPSRVFAELGGHTMDGYRQGLQRREAGPLRQIGEFGNRLKRAGAGLAVGAAASLPAAADMPIDNRPPLQASSGNVTVQGDNITLNVYPSEGMDERMLAQYIERMLEERDRQKGVRIRSAFHDID